MNLPMLENVYGEIFTIGFVIVVFSYIIIETWKMYKDLPDTDEEEDDEDF